MKRHFVFAILTLAIPFSSHALAAQATFVQGGQSYTLRTNTTGGTCIVTPLVDGSTDIDCIDNPSRAKANSVTGCLLVEASGQCLTAPLPIHTFASIAVNCGNDNVYDISTGDDSSESNCSTTHVEKKTVGGSCDDGKGNTAAVDCTLNDGEGDCTRTTGSGSCSKRDKPEA